MSPEEREREERERINTRLHQCWNQDYRDEREARKFSSLRYPQLSTKEKFVRTGLWLRRAGTSGALWLILLGSGVGVSLSWLATERALLQRENTSLTEAVNGLADRMQKQQNLLLDETYRTNVYKNRLQESSPADYQELACRERAGGLNPTLVLGDIDRFMAVEEACRERAKPDLTKP